METQQSVSHWAEQIFGPIAEPAVLVRRAETELQELLQAVQDGNTEEIGKETADVVILLMRLLEQNGLSLSNEVDKKMQENRARKWIKKGDGTGSHIKG